MRKEICDIAIVGSGPGGYVAALLAAQAGKKVFLIENCEIGGLCLNRGCIPTKTLFASAKALYTLRKAKDLAITTSEVSFDFSTAMKRKETLVSKMRSNLTHLLISQKVTLFSGSFRFLSPTEFLLEGKETLTLEAPFVILATGSEAIESKTFPFDHHYILSSDSLLQLTTLPKKLAIIGAGYIGCEFASLFSEMGSEVALIEDQASILSSFDSKVSRCLQELFIKQGVEVFLNTHIDKIEKKPSGVEIFLADKGAIDADKVLVSIGRKANTSSLALEKAKVMLDSKGWIAVNEEMRTSQAHIFAIGDVTGKKLLAHVASHQAKIAVENILGKKRTISYTAVPSTIFTLPEIASVGLTLEEAEKLGPAKAVEIPFRVIGKAYISQETEGLARLIFSPITGKILGAHLIGNEASSLLGEMTLAVEKGLCLDDLQNLIHVHPTLSEIWMEALFSAQGTPLHFHQKKSPS